MIEADLLILLSDVDGLYQGNPKKDKDVKKFQRYLKLIKKLKNLVIINLLSLVVEEWPQKF